MNVSQTLISFKSFSIQTPIRIRWYKYEGTFSERVILDRDTLYIQDAQVDDSGIYICQAQDGSEIVRDNVTLTVGGKFAETFKSNFLKS